MVISYATGSAHALRGERRGLTGFTALLMFTISSNSSDSCLCRPEVSTMMTSNRSACRSASKTRHSNDGTHLF